MDLEKLLSLLEATEGANCELKGKDVILLLGKTGSGKSTTVHFLAGSSMSLCDGRFQVSLPDVHDESLRSVIIDHSSNSSTKTLQTVRLELVHLASDSKEVYLCDTPGFDDTGGVELDIANMHGLTSAIHKCKSVRPVVLLSQDGLGGRFEGLTELARILAKFVKDADQVFEHFTFLCTKFSKSYDIHHSIETLLGSISNLDQSSLNILLAAEKQTALNTSIIDLSDREQPKILLEQILSKNAISEPSKFFKFTRTKTSDEKLNEQIFSHQKSVINSMEKKNYELIDLKLSQLKKLKSFLGDTSAVGLGYSNVCDELETHFAKIFIDTKAFIHSQIDNGNLLTQTDMERFKGAVDALTNARSIIKEHLSESDLEEQLLNEVVLAANKLSKLIVSHSFQDGLHETWLENMRVLCRAYDEKAKPVYQEMCETLAKLLSDKTELFSRNVGKITDFADAVKSLSYLQSLERFVKSLPEQEQHQSSSSFTDSCNLMMQYFSSVSKNFLEMNLWDEDAIESIDSLLDQIANAQTSPILSSIKDSLHGITEKMIARLQVQIQDYVVTIDEVVKNEMEEDSLEKIKTAFFDLVKIIKVRGIGNRSDETLQRTKKKICQSVTSLTKKSISQLSIINSEKTNVDLKDAIMVFNLLKDAEWLDLVQPGLYLSTVAQFNRSLNSSLQYLLDDLDQIHLHDRDCSRLKLALNAYHLVGRLKSICDGDALLKVEENMNRFHFAIQETFTQMTDFYTNNRKHLTQQEPDQESPVTSDNGFMKIDAKFCKSSISYLNQLEQHSTRFKKSEVDQINNLRKEYFVYYWRSFESRFQRCLDFLDRRSTANNEDHQVSRLVEKLVEFLKEIELLKSRYKLVYDEMSECAEFDLMEHFIDRLKSYANSLKMQIHQDSNINRSDFNQPFTSIFEDFSKRQDDHVKKLVDTIEQKAAKFDYRSVGYQLADLCSQSVGVRILKQIKFQIEVSIRTQIELAKKVEKRIYKNLDFEQIEKLEAHLRILSTAEIELYSLLTKDECHDYTHVLSIEMRDELRKSIELIVSNIKHKLDRHLDGILESILHKNFVKAETDLEIYERTFGMLAEFMADQQLDLKEKQIRIAKKLEESLLELVKMYQTIPIADYVKLIPRVLVSKLDASPNEVHREMSIEIKESIKRNIQDYLFDRDEQQVSQTSSQMRIEFVENLLWYIPSDLLEPVRAEMRKCEQKLKTVKQKATGEVDMHIDQGRIEELSSLYRNETTSKDTKSYIECRVIEQINRNLVELNKNLEDENTQASRYQCEILTKYYDNFKSLMPDSLNLKKAKLNLRQRILKSESLIQSFAAGSVRKSEIVKVEASLDDLIAAVKIIESSKFLEELKSNSLESVSVELFKYVEAKYEECINALERNNAIRFENSLEIVCVSQGLVRRLDVLENMSERKTDKISYRKLLTAYLGKLDSLITMINQIGTHNFENVEWFFKDVAKQVEFFMAIQDSVGYRNPDSCFAMHLIEKTIEINSLAEKILEKWKFYANSLLKHLSSANKLKPIYEEMIIFESSFSRILSTSCRIEETESKIFAECQRIKPAEKRVLFLKNLSQAIPNLRSQVDLLLATRLPVNDTKFLLRENFHAKNTTFFDEQSQFCFVQFVKDICRYALIGH